MASLAFHDSNRWVSNEAVETAAAVVLVMLLVAAAVCFRNALGR